MTQRVVAKTIDGGRTWSEVPLVADHAVRQFGIGFADENTGWVGTTTGGVGVFFPGLDEKDPRVDQLIKRHGYRFIEGTSDYISSADQPALQQAAYDYAYLYNSLLYPHVPK